MSSLYERDIEDSVGSGFSDISLGDLLAGSSSASEEFSKNSSIVASSKGSLKHAHGSCVPCICFSRRRCNLGQDCEYCHADHPKVGVKRDKTKQKAIQDEQAATPSPDTLQVHMNIKRLFESVQGQHDSRESASTESQTCGTSDNKGVCA